MMKKISWWLMAIGALNWGLVGVGGFFGSNWNVVELLFGGIPVLMMVIYALIGLSAVYALASCHCGSCKKDGACRACSSGSYAIHGGSSEM